MSNLHSRFRTPQLGGICVIKQRFPVLEPRVGSCRRQLRQADDVPPALPAPGLLLDHARHRRQRNHIPDQLRLGSQGVEHLGADRVLPGHLRRRHRRNAHRNRVGQPARVAAGLRPRRRHVRNHGRTSARALRDVIDPEGPVHHRRRRDHPRSRRRADSGRLVRLGPLALRRPAVRHRRHPRRSAHGILRPSGRGSHDGRRLDRPGRLRRAGDLRSQPCCAPAVHPRQRDRLGDGHLPRLPQHLPPNPESHGSEEVTQEGCEARFHNRAFRFSQGLVV